MSLPAQEWVRVCKGSSFAWQVLISAICRYLPSMCLHRDEADEKMTRSEEHKEHHVEASSPTATEADQSAESNEVCHRSWCVCVKRERERNLIA